jgi:hypothetical protein
MAKRFPEPSELDAIVSDPDVIDGGARAGKRMCQAARRGVNITLPEDLLAASRAGHARSGLLAQAVRERVERDRDAA